MTLAVSARPAEAQFTPFSHDTRNILEGTWQSCRERDGQYSERVYDHAVSGVSKFEVHLGPRREFAIFAGVQDAHRDQVRRVQRQDDRVQCELDGEDRQQFGHRQPESSRMRKSPAHITRESAGERRTQRFHASSVTGISCPAVAVT